MTEVLEPMQEVTTEPDVAAGIKTKQPAGMIAFEAPWIEKYRPQQLRDVQGNTEIVSRLESIARDGSMPNIIIAGPPGTGKTTSILALARALLGNSFKDAVLELNASDERGIDVVRNRIKMFAQKKVTLPAGRHKVIILDEADSMTSSAQQALRRTMELFSNTTRFALACNISTKIIEPIQSRCAILRFSKLTDQEVLNRIIQVTEMESVTYENSGLEALVFSAEGDMRNALNNLQATVAGFGHVNDANVFKVVDQPHPKKVRAVVEACLGSDIYLAQTRLQELWNHGFSCYDLIGTFFKVVKYYDMNETIKLEFIKEIGFTHMRIADGATTFLQLMGLLAKLCEIAKKLSMK